MLNVGPRRFQFTRHATSCNNIKVGKASIGFIGDLFGDRLRTDSAPSLSAYGIREAMMLAQKNYGTDRFKIPVSPIVVSPLIRTWETAVLLYGYQPRQDVNLEFYVCPYLVESGLVGNDPKPLNHAIPKFIKFLDTFKSNKMLELNYNINTITICIPPKGTPEKQLPSFETRNDWQKIKITLDPNTGKYMPPANFCDIEDTFHEKKAYTRGTGNMQEFMKWYIDVLDNRDSQETIHVIAHNTIMQEFIKKNLKPAKLSEDTPKQNCWTITIPYHPEYNESEKKEIMSTIQDGFPNPEKYEAKGLSNAKEEEITTKYSLCGEAGSVNALNCSAKEGGRRTRRKRSYRKKTRRHRRHRR
jgi:hypothetical protein